jgi:hypothetical protein
MLDVYRDLIDELLGTPTEIRGLIEAAGDSGVPADVKRQIAELRDRDRAVLDRAQAMTRQENVYLKELRVAEPAGDEDLGQLFGEMEATRGDLVSLLINLSLKDWERTAIHETKGEVTLADEIEQHVEFDESFRRRLRELMTRS